MEIELKMNSAYKEAKKTGKRYRVLYGGAGSGKSHFVAQETIVNLLSNKNYQYLIVRKTGKSLRNSVYKLLTSIILENNLSKFFKYNKTDLSIECINGSKIIMSGLDDVEKLKSIAGINRIWIEEASEISEGDFNQLDLRIRGLSQVGHQLTLTFNPISELHWIKKSFFDIGRENSFILKTTYKNNNFLDEAYINTLINLEKQDYQYYRIYALGEWGSLGNVIFTNWSKENLKEIKNSFDVIFNGLDWGFAEDPTAYVRVYYNSKKKEIYIFDELYERNIFIEQIASELKCKMSKELVTCDSTEPRSIADLKRHGINARPAKKGAGSLEHGVKWLQSHKIIVDEQCVNAIKELSTYKWKEDKDGNILTVPVDKNNHLIDALRYALESEMKQANKWGW